MNRRQLSHIFKKKMLFWEGILFSKKERLVSNRGENEFIKSQLKEGLRFGNNLVVMRMGN